MSLTATAVLAALIASLLPLLLLARHDPKRLRAAGRRNGRPHRSRIRQLLTAATLLPGAALIGLDYWPAFLIWLGALTAIGWLLVQLMAVQPPPEPPARRLP